MVLIKYVIVFFLLGLGISQASFGLDRIDQDLIGSTNSLEDTVQLYVEFILGFLYIIAVAVGIFGGFTILTAAGEEEKVKTGRNYLIYMVVGILIIFLAGSIIQFVIESILEPRLKPQESFNL